MAVAKVNRQKGMILSESFDVYDLVDTKDDDKMIKDAEKELKVIESEDDEEPENLEIKPDVIPAIPLRTSSRESPIVITTPVSKTMDELQKEYADIAKYKIFQLAGDDLTGRPVIAFSACRLPVRNLIDHQKLLRFLKDTLEHYVENDYTIVYFHYGLSSQNKPSLKWLLQVYRELDRKYKKNLKALYMVHPSSFIKIVFNMFYPFISKKFGQKINNINKLDDLAPHIRLDQLDIPKEVRDHDEQIAAKFKTQQSSVFHAKLEKPKTQQFGVTLQHLKNMSGETIPIIVRTAIEFLEQHALDVEGIFRRSASAVQVNETVNKLNQGGVMEYTQDDVHLASAILKKFLRDLPEPLLSFALYDKIMDACSLPDEERLAYSRKILKENLAEINYTTLQYLLTFLQKVVDHLDKNRMTSASLAIVFGPNLLWSQNETSTLTSMSKINSYSKFLIDNSHIIFDESFA